MAEKTPSRLNERLIEEVAQRLAADKRVRRTLPPGGRINVDRQLPFLFVYRPREDFDDHGFAALVTGEASYLVAPSSARSRAWTSRLVRRTAEAMAEVFGGFLVVELWPDPQPPGLDDGILGPGRPRFEVVYSKQDEGSAVVARLAKSLGLVRILKSRAEVETSASSRLSPPGLPRLLTATQSKALGVSYIGIQVRPVFFDTDTMEEYPLVRRSLARQMARALRQTAFEFSRKETIHRPLHYQALGRRAFVRAVTGVDAALARVAESFDLLMTVTPANAEAAFRAFRRAKYQRPPRFLYRPTAVDPALLKREIYNIQIEKVEDPTLEDMFREKRRELDLKLTLLEEREGKRFLHTSMALYGEIGEDLISTARDLITALPNGGSGSRGRTIDAATFQERARAELDRYRSVHPGMDGEVIIRDDMISLMVSAGNLFIGSSMTFPVRRVEPLLQHEVGTHVVTFWNGRAQPFRLLASGLASHDELQEGLAVFAEHLVGGLTPGRLRTLAGRVLAVRSVIDGAEFLDTFRLLRDDHGFTARTSYLIAMRVHRGGGLTKDAVYLRGLLKVLDYLRAGQRLETLFIGKMAAEHAPIIEELQRRRVLVPPPLRPAYLDDPDTHYRIERVRQGIDVVGLTDL